MRWILGTGVLLLIGFLLQLDLLVYAMYVLAGILILTRTLSSIWIQGLTSTRYVQEKQLEIGDSVQISVTVNNNLPFTIPWVLMEEEGPVDDLTCSPPRLKLKGSRLSLESLKPKSNHGFNYEAKFSAPGYYPLGPVQVETGDVFGLHQRHRTLGKRDGILVLPKIIPIQRNQWESNRALGETSITHRLFEDPARYSGIRPYQAGDPLNRIHWRATARTGHLQTRIFDPTCIQGATIVIDFHLESFEGAKAIAESQLLVTTAASLAHAFHEKGEQVGLMALAGDKAERIQREDLESIRKLDSPWFARSPKETGPIEEAIIVPTKKGEHQLPVIKESLAKMEFAKNATFAPWISNYQNRLPRDASVIVIARTLNETLLHGLIALKASKFRISLIQVNWQSEIQPDWAAPSPERAALASTGVPVFHVRQEQDIPWLGSNITPSDARL